MVDEFQLLTETTRGQPSNKRHQCLKESEEESHPKYPYTLLGEKAESVRENHATDYGDGKAVHRQCYSQQPDIQ
jgi:hypothetical protein